MKYTWCTEVIVSTQLESSRFEFSARGQGSTRRFHSMEENASSSSSAILGAQGCLSVLAWACLRLLACLFACLLACAGLLALACYSKRHKYMFLLIK